LYSAKFLKESGRVDRDTLGKMKWGRLTESKMHWNIPAPGERAHKFSGDRVDWTPSPSPTPFCQPCQQSTHGRITNTDKIFQHLTDNTC